MKLRPVHWHHGHAIGPLGALKSVNTLVCAGKRRGGPRQDDTKPNVMLAESESIQILTQIRYKCLLSQFHSFNLKNTTDSADQAKDNHYSKSPSQLLRLATGRAAVIISRTYASAKSSCPMRCAASFQVWRTV